MTTPDPRIAGEHWGQSGMTYWIELVPGFVFKGAGIHNIAAFSPEEAHAKLAKVVPCDCASCRILLRPGGRQPQEGL